MEFLANQLKLIRVRRAAKWLDRRFDVLEDAELALISLMTAKVFGDLASHLNTELGEFILNGPQYPIEERYHYYFGLKGILRDIIEKQEQRKAEQVEKSKYDRTYFTDNRKTLIPLESAERIFRDTNRLLIVALGASIDQKTEKIAKGLWNKISNARKRIFDDLTEEACRNIRRLGFGPLGLAAGTEDLETIQAAFNTYEMPQPWFMRNQESEEVSVAA